MGAGAGAVVRCGVGREKAPLKGVVMESTLKGIREEGASVLDPKSTVGGGVEDVYGEDRATEEQLVTPWTLSVARSSLSVSVCVCVCVCLSGFMCF